MKIAICSALYLLGMIISYYVGYHDAKDKSLSDYTVDDPNILSV